MANLESSAPINGTYGANGAGGYGNHTGAASQNSTNAAPQEQIGKDEVGWYFVEQYYTTLSKTPDKLYLFYNKRSQFVSGTEEDKVNVCVGQKAINDRIKELDFSDTKVRVTNVDSQGSDANIVIQVIGEISNKGQPHKRFVQTFILAEQTNGYFVLNDIFRYLAEDAEDEEDLQQDVVPAPTASQDDAHTVAKPEVEAAEKDTKTEASGETLGEVNPKLEAAATDSEKTDAPATTNGSSGTKEPEETLAEEPTVSEPEADVPASHATEAPVVEEQVDLEKPREPAPTPAPTAPKAAPPAGPPKPAVPRTWADLLTPANKGLGLPAPAAATAAASTAAPSTTASQSKALTSAPSQPAAVPASTTTPARETSPVTSQGETAGWQTAGTKKEQPRTQTQAPAEGEQKRAYIKNVYSQVEDGALRAALSKFGEIEYLDISRGKNCAFVDFKTGAAFQAAVNANPHTVNGIELKVEERRLRPQQGFNGFPRGGAPRGRGSIGGQGRGGFNPRGGRGSLGRGGRPTSQDT